MIHRLVKNDYSLVFGNQIKDGYETSATHHDLLHHRRAQGSTNTIFLETGSRMSILLDYQGRVPCVQGF